MKNGTGSALLYLNQMNGMWIKNNLAPGNNQLDNHYL